MNTARRILLSVSLLCAAFLYAAESGNDLFQKGLAKERTEADFRGAIKLYERVVKENSKDRKLAALALFRIGECQQALGSADARKTFERIVKDYGDQADVVAQAQARLAGASSNSMGKALRQIASGPDAAIGWLGGSISSDGRYLAFYSNREVVVRDLFAKTSRVVARMPATEDARDGTVVWSPDGKRLAFCTYHLEGSRQLGVVNADGTGSRILVGPSSEGGIYLEAWSPDSKRILAVSFVRKPQSFSYVWVNASDAKTIRSIPISTVPRQRTTRVSPDGAYIAVGTNNGKISLIASDGKGETAVGIDDDTPVGWSQDGRYVLAARNASFSPNGPGPSLWAIPVSAGNARGEPVMVHRKFESDKWEVNGAQVQPARVHFLGTTTFGALYYSVLFTTDRPEIWALENFLPQPK